MKEKEKHPIKGKASSINPEKKRENMAKPAGTPAKPQSPKPKR